MNPRRHKDFAIPLLTVLSDVVAMEAAFLFSYWIRFFSPFTTVFEVTKGTPDIIEYVVSSIVVIPIWLWIFNQRKMYRSRRAVYFSDEFFAIIRLIVFGMVVVMALAFFYRGFSYSRLVFVLLGIVSVAFISVGRFFILKFEQWWYRTGHDLRSVVIIGTSSSARRVYEIMSSHPSLGYKVIGYFSPSDQSELDAPRALLLGSLSDVVPFVKSNDIEIVFVALEARDHPFLPELVRECEGFNTEIMMVPDTLELMTSGVRLREIEGIPFMPLKVIPMSTWNQIIKRTFDVVFATVVLVLVSPIFALIAIMVKLESRGRVFFLQERVGLDGTSFNVIKFRSMRANAEQESGPVWATKGDPRTTRFGRIIRRFSLDELPQFINVLKGDMSIVGPRPERPHFVEQFKKAVPKYLERHRVKTGLTGWAQVNGLRGNASIEERTKYDVYYVENWSLVFDLKIILKTMRAVLFGEDAY